MNQSFFNFLHSSKKISIFKHTNSIKVKKKTKMSVVTFQIQNTCQQEIHIKVQNNDRSEENRVNHYKSNTLIATKKANNLAQTNDSHSPFFEAIRKNSKQCAAQISFQINQFSSLNNALKQANVYQQKQNSRKNTMHVQNPVTGDQSSTGRSTPNSILLKQRIESYSYQKRKLTNYYSEIKLTVYREKGRFKVHQWNIDFDRLYCQQNYFISQTGIHVKKQFDSCIVSLTIEKNLKDVEEVVAQQGWVKNIIKNKSEHKSKTIIQFYQEKATQIANNFIHNVFDGIIQVLKQEQQQKQRIYRNKLQIKKNLLHANNPRKSSFIKGNTSASFNFSSKQSHRQARKSNNNFLLGQNKKQQILQKSMQNKEARKSCYPEKYRKMRNFSFNIKASQQLKFLGDLINENIFKSRASIRKKSTLIEHSDQQSVNSFQNSVRKGSRFKRQKVQSDNQNTIQAKNLVRASRKNKSKIKTCFYANKDNQSSAENSQIDEKASQRQINGSNLQQNLLFGQEKSRQRDFGFQIEPTIADFNRSRVQKYNQIEKLCIFYNSILPFGENRVLIDKISDEKQNLIMKSLYKSEMLKSATMQQYDKSQYKIADESCQDLITRIFPPAYCLPYKKDCFRI